jgi:hypothetical protein
MNVTDIIFSIIEKISEDQDAKTIISCAGVNRQWNNVVNKYHRKFFDNQWMWVYQLTKNPRTMQNFQTSILNLLLRETQISPIVEDTWKLIRFLKRVGEPVTMGLCLDRSIPNNSKTGNGFTYDPDDTRLLTHVQQCIVNWLWQSGYCEDLRDRSFEWSEVETETDKLFDLMSAHFPSHQDLYHNFDLFSDENNENGSKISLYLNKLKIIYQITETV